MLQRGLDLEPHGVAWICQPRRCSVVGLADPVRTDHGDDDVAGNDCLRDPVDEVGAGPNAVDVEEDGFLTVLLDQMVCDAARCILIDPAVRHHDHSHGNPVQSISSNALQSEM